MRKIEKEMLQAIENRKSANLGNTSVVCENDGSIKVYLHGNKIYEERGGVRHYSSCGYPTLTTASRLRALGADVKLKIGQSITLYGARI